MDWLSEETMRACYMGRRGEDDLMDERGRQMVLRATVIDGAKLRKMTRSVVRYINGCSVETIGSKAMFRTRRMGRASLVCQQRLVGFSWNSWPHVFHVGATTYRTNIIILFVSEISWETKS